MALPDHQAEVIWAFLIIDIRQHRVAQMQAQPTPWTCPHCNRPTTITPTLTHIDCQHLQIGDSRHGTLAIAWTAIRCPNPQCSDVTIEVAVGHPHYEDHLNAFVLEAKDRLIDTTRLWPESSYTLQPEFIPQQLRDDYYEACRIRDLSPKAAATLARRCLQGIIRDFWNVKDRNLQAEIAALRDRIDKPLWEAIDAVRQLGNIGAHMEKDVNVIIAIDQNEAKKLLSLVEILFKECYGGARRASTALGGDISSCQEEGTGAQEVSAGFPEP